MSNPILHCIYSEEQTPNLAKHIYLFLKNENVKLVFLRGQMGSGKTTFCQKFIGQFNQEIAIQSPTYAYMNEYFVNNHYIWHFDLYRIPNKSDISDLGIVDFIHRDDGMAIIEWPEVLGNLYDTYKIVTLHFHHIDNENKRVLILTTNY